MAAGTVSVVVLGATGCLGSRVCAAFGSRGARVTRVSRTAAPGVVGLDLSTAAAESIADMLLAVRPDAVVNAAGAVWQVDQQQMRAGNAEAVTRLVDAMARLPCRPRLVHLGSAHEYGPALGRSPITEELPENPVSAYGRTKLVGTRAVLRAARRGDVDGTVLRVSNVTGPGSPDSSLLGSIALQLTEAGRVLAAGGRPAALRLAPLTVWRDFVDVRDVADAVLAAAAGSPAVDPADRLLNIGRGEAVQVRALVERLIAAGGFDVPVVEVPDPSAPVAGDRGSGASWECLDISRARTRLRWRPRRTLDRSLRDLLADCANRQGEVRP
jgi:nucleoside-diphosphate-sugar epimerase